MSQFLSKFAVHQDDPAENICRVPGNVFFCETVEAPAGIEGEELDSFAELSMEALSPLPVEQLNWGYQHCPGSNRLLVYAAHHSRLVAEGFEALERYHFVLPDFASLTGARFEELTDVTLRNEQTHSLLRFQPGSTVPEVLACVYLEDSTPQHIESELKSATLGMPIARRELSLDAAEPTITNEGTVTFHHVGERVARNEGWEAIHRNTSQLWAADVRMRGFKTAERDRRQKSRLLFRVLGWAALLALALLVAEIALASANLWLNKEAARVAERAGQVLTIADRNSLKEKLEQVARSELRPVEILEVANRLRPKGIYFTETTVEGENVVTIDGVAGRVTEFNSYIRSLEQTGQFELTETPRTKTSGSTTTFSVTFNYTHNGNNAPEPPPTDVDASAAVTTTG